MLRRIKLGLPIFITALNMRAGLVLIGPLIPIIQKYFGLTTLQVSLLAAVPIICFSTTSLFMNLVSRLGSSNRIITWALTALSAGLIARAFTGLVGLFVFSFLIGISIAILNYEIPVWVKSHASSDAGFMTGVYVTIMGVTSAISVAISVPLAELNNTLSWRGAMIPWMALSILATLYWNLRMRKEERELLPEVPNFWRAREFKNPLAWALVFFFGFESMTFYATSTWLPTLLTTKEFSLSGAALALSVAGLIGSLVGLAAPHYIEKITDMRLILVAVSAITGISFFMMTVQSGAILFIWLCLANIGVSIAFPVALLLCSTKSNTPEGTRILSTMMQSVGYLLSALGPIYMARLYEISNDWNAALHGVVVLSAMQLIMGWIVGRPSKIES